jgi:WD40 repeat protein
VEGLEVDSTRTPWTTGGLHRDSTRISGGVINTVPLKGHSSCINSVAFSPDGKHIVSGSDDKTIRVWNIEADYQHMEGHTDCVTHSPGSRSIVKGPPEAEILPLSVFELNNGIKMNNSWVCGPGSEKLFWVPPECHAGLYQPRNTVIIGQLLKTRLDFSEFQHGTMWTECSL